jgi:hypothetical protein
VTSLASLARRLVGQILLWKVSLFLNASLLSTNLTSIAVAQEKFSESTLGVPVPEGFEGNANELAEAILWKSLFDRKTFRISVVPDVEGVGLCGALKSRYLPGPV